MIKKIVFVSLISLFAGILNVESQQYSVRNKIVLTNKDRKLSKLVVMLPLAQTNQYQTVNNVNVNGGIMVGIPETDDVYIRWIYTKNLPAINQSKEIYYEFDVTLKPFEFDFNRINTIYPYNTTSDNYTWYTGKSGVYVDPDNPVIQEIGNSIWDVSADIVDYAKRCYEYVATSFTYLNPYTGLHPLQETLDAGGGDCGNLSAVFISLLRNKNIPARHIVTVRPDGTFHVWADFFLEYYGWIPVDVTYKNSNPDGDYFGKYDGNGIVMTKEVWLELDRGNGDKYHTEFLQNYNWWVWSNGGYDFSSSYNLIASLNEKQEMETPSEIFIYPNATSKIINVENLKPNGENDAIISIYDTKGDLILEQKLLKEKPFIDVSKISKGVYSIIVLDGDKKFTEQLVINDAQIN